MQLAFPYMDTLKYVRLSQSPYGEASLAT